ncbi:MAG TPA: nitroreductase/quinone reductase family protein [Candidatus Limnocylindria bacterium]|nr:nitroreductase/quinone reductase family protein [Candidatus Limnocylindria bacterium]
MSVKVPPKGTRGSRFPRFLVGFANRIFVRQFRRRPDATIEFGDGRRFAVRAESLEGEELEAARARIAVEAPEYVKYRSKTDRHIPVVRLRGR